VGTVWPVKLGVVFPLSSNSFWTMCHHQQWRSGPPVRRSSGGNSHLWSWGSCSWLCWDANHEEVLCIRVVVQVLQLGKLCRTLQKLLSCPWSSLSWV